MAIMLFCPFPSILRRKEILPRIYRIYINRQREVQILQIDLA